MATEAVEECIQVSTDPLPCGPRARKRSTQLAKRAKIMRPGKQNADLETITDLSNQLRNAQGEVSELKARNVHLEMQQNDKRQLIKTLKAQNAYLETTLVDWNNQLRSAQDETKELKAQNARLETSVEENDKLRKRWAAALSNRRLIMTFQARNDYLEKRNDELRKDRLSNRRSIKALEERNAHLQTMLADLGSQLKNAHDKTKELSGRITAIEAVKALLKMEVEELGQKLSVSEQAEHDRQPLAVPSPPPRTSQCGWGGAQAHSQARLRKSSPLPRNGEAHPLTRFLPTTGHSGVTGLSGAGAGTS